MIALEKKVGPEGPVIKGNACLRGGVNRVFELGYQRGKGLDRVLRSNRRASHGLVE